MGTSVQAFAIALDGSRVVYRAAQDTAGVAEMESVPLNGGEVEFLTGANTADQNPWPSPDGQWIAFNSLPVEEYTTANGVIKRMPSSGGETQVLTRTLDAHAREFRWAPDGQELFLLVSERGRICLCRVPAAGGPVETVISEAVTRIPLSAPRSIGGRLPSRRRTKVAAASKFAQRTALT